MGRITTCQKTQAYGKFAVCFRGQSSFLSPTPEGEQLWDNVSNYQKVSLFVVPVNTISQKKNSRAALQGQLLQCHPFKITF